MDIVYWIVGSINIHPIPPSSLAAEGSKVEVAYATFCLAGYSPFSPGGRNPGGGGTPPIFVRGCVSRGFLTTVYFSELFCK